MVKRVVVWVIGVMAIFAVVTGLLLFVVRNFLFIPANFGKYAGKADCYLHPEAAAMADIEKNGSIEGESKEQTFNRKLSAYLAMRSLLDDTQVKIDMGSVIVFSVDNSYAILTNEERDAVLSDGVFFLVKGDYADNQSNLSGNIGVVKVNDMCKAPYASQLLDAIDKDERARVYLRTYGIQNSVVVPMHIVVTDYVGNEIADIDCGSAPEGYKVVDSNTAVIMNISTDDEFSVTDQNLPAAMRLVMQGTRSVDQITEQEKGKLRFGQSYEDTRTKWGFGNYTDINTYVADQNALVYIHKVSYMKAYMVFLIPALLIWTLFMALYSWASRNK